MELSNLKSKLRTLPSKTQASLRQKPALWVGIAAGAGLAIGIAGRIARHRMSSKDIPTLVIIEGAC